MMGRGSGTLRTLLSGRDIVVAPGAYDAITARLIEQAGFPAVYMTGAGTSAARGYPDYGLITMSEMVDDAAVIAQSVSIPLISDADTGYGNELNVTRTVREFEGRGVSAIHIEDQDFPKRCGHVDGKIIIPREAFISKIRAAVAARRSPDFLIIARTDARAVAGLDEAIARARLAMEAGADLAFVEALQTLAEVAAIPSAVGGQCLLNLVAGGKTPPVTLPEAEAMGYKLAILPGAVFGPMLAACDQALVALKEARALPPSGPEASIAATFRRFGAEEWDGLRRTYDAPQEA